MVPKFKEIREQLQKAEQVAVDLQAISALDQSLVGQVKSSISKAKESQILQKLAELPVENMRDATDTSLRVETLKKFGITNVASVYLSTEQNLERISGISKDSARELKAIAEQMYRAVSDSISYGIKIDNLSADDLKLLENVQDIESIRKELREGLSKV